MGFLQLWWRSLVQFGFRLLYNQFASAYDMVARIVSRGEWGKWQRASIPYLRGPQILEIAFGTGNLFLGLLDNGWQAFGIDLSPAMVKIAARKLFAAKRPLSICRARGQALPFNASSFDSVVLTFPTPFLLETKSQGEIHRVLKPGGRLVIVDGGMLLGRDLWSRFLSWAFLVTGGSRHDQNRVSDSLAAMAFSWRREEVKWEKSLTQVWIGEKP